MPWVLWQNEEHGEALRALYREKYNVNADDEEQEEGAQGGEEEEEGEKGEGGQGDGEDEKGEGEKRGSDNDGDDEEEGRAANGRSVTLHRKYALAQGYWAGLDEEEQAKLKKEREDDYQERLAAHKRLAQGEVACSPEELAE
jgi:hypothetical protein